MIPVKVKWFRNCARSRLWTAWILVKCCLHRKAPFRFRLKYTKAADWLEAAVELALARNGCSDNQRNRDKLQTVTKVYKELQTDVETLCTRRQDFRWKFENIKIKFVALLDLCDIKNTDIPIFDEPNAVRYNQQTLITSFGTISKRSPPTMPRRHRRARCDASAYADMLIQQLLLAQANSVTDSDTSPPRAEGLPILESEIQNNNNEKVVIPCNSPNPVPQPYEASVIMTPGPTLRYDLQRNININDCPKIAKSLPNHIPQSITCNGDKRTPSHNTTDSGVAVSDHSLVLAACSYTQQIGESNQLSTQNQTLGSTPELPTSQSSTSLDIQFASFFDLMDCQDSARNLPIEGDLPPEFIQHHSNYSHPENSPVQPGMNHFQFPVRYSHSYARHFAAIEADAPEFCRTFSEHAHMSPPPVPRSGTSPLSCPQEKPKVTVPDNIDTSHSDFNFYEPLVVCLPPEPTQKSLKHVYEKHNLNIDKYYELHLGDKKDVLSDSRIDRPPIPPRRPLTDSKICELKDHSRLSRVSKTLEPSLASTYSEKKCTIYSTFENLAQCPRRRQAESDSSFISEVSLDLSSKESSWSYCHVPNAPQSVAAKYTGKAHTKENCSKICDHFVTVRSREPLSLPEVILDRTDGSSSKRRKGNNKQAVSLFSQNPEKTLRSARQRLIFSSPAKSRNAETSSPDSDVGYPFPACSSSSQIRHRKISNLSSVREQQKENNSQSPYITRSPRQPLAELHNLKLHNPSNRFYSHDTNDESSETSQDGMLPSREDELRDRDAYYCDFTVDRQHKIDNFISTKVKPPSSAEESENHSAMEDNLTSEILTRKVEGAESSPSNFVFRAPPPSLRAPRTAVRLQMSSRASSKFKCQNDNSRDLRTQRTPLTSRCFSSNSSSQGYPDFSSTNSSGSRNQAGPTSSPSRSSSKSKSSSSRKSCTSHPIASSTLIMDSSSCSPPNFDKSYICNTKYQPLVTRDRSKHVSSNEKVMEITAMVSRFDEIAHSRHFISDSTPRASTGGLCPQDPVSRSVNNTVSDGHILAADHSFLKTANTNNRSQQYSELSSGQSSNQGTNTSMFLNCARTSITCSTEGSNIPEFTYSKHISASEPNLRVNHSDIKRYKPFSLIPSDTGSASDSSSFENRPDIPGRSNTSSSSSCTAARCRPLVVKKSPENLSETSSEIAPHNVEPNRIREQGLLDSILTDSPKSVDSSGIFAPHNSYNSPIESVGSHNGYSSTVSSSISTDTNNGRTWKGLFAPPPTPQAAPPTQEHPAKVSKCKTGKKIDFFIFRRPFTPAPHVDHTVTRKNKGVTADTQTTPHRPVSVLSDPPCRRSVFAVPPGIVTGPPKIKDKNSLIRKFMKFSSNFYKRTEKIHTLANL